MDIAVQAQLPELGDPGPATLIPTAEFFKPINYVTFKVTSGCNLHCSYCNMEVSGPKVPTMSLDLFRRVVDTYVANATSRLLWIELHGGEPLLLGDDWIAEAVAYANSLGARSNKKVCYRMQTNGVLLTEKRLAFLQDLGFQIGISCDGPPPVNDRKRQAGKAVERAIRLAIASKGPCGVLLVMSKSNCRDMYGVMEYFRSLGLRAFRINYLQPQGWGRAEELMSADDMFEGVSQCWRHMVDTKCSVIEGQVQIIINRMMLGRLHPAPLSCWEYECQAGRTYVAVNPAGDVFACGTDLSHHRLGHIDAPFERDHVTGTLRTLHKKDKWYVRCFDCSARRICAQSCPTSDYHDLAYREAECAYTKRFYRYLAERMDLVAAVHAQMKSTRTGRVQPV